METALEKSRARSHAYLFFVHALIDPVEPPRLVDLRISADALAQSLAAAGLECARARVEALRESLSAHGEPGTLREEALRLFGYLRAADCSPYETEYSNTHVFQRAQQMADIAGFYRAFGLEPSSEGERVDHIAAELEFMHFLSAKEAYAYAQDLGQAEVCRDAQRKFLQDHLARWTGIFAQAVGQTTGEKFFVEITRLLDEFVTADAATLGARPERMTVPPLRPSDEDEQRSCGASGDFVEISQLGGKP